MFKIILAIFILFIFVGCSINSSFTQGKITKIDPKSLHDTSLDFGTEDLHIVVEKMISSMLKHQLFDGTPVLDIRDIENKTDEHIDTKSITDSIRVMVIKSNRAKFVDISMREIINQNSSKHIAQGYILDGAITSIKKRTSNQIIYFYKIMLQLHNIESASIDWIDEQKIIKVYEK